LGFFRGYGAKGKKVALEGSKNGPGKEEPRPVSGGGKRDPEPPANPDQTADPSGPGPSEDSADPEGTTPEQEAKQESEERMRGLLEAYQEVLEAVEELPALVWVTWDRKGLGRYFKVPYLRWFLAYFVTYHIDRSLNTLERRLNAIGAFSGDPDSNRKTRETVKLFLQSLPKPP
jgi:hypothetical protein